MKTQFKYQICDDLNLTSITISQQIIIVQHVITSGMFNLRDYVRAAMPLFLTVTLFRSEFFS